MKRAEAAVSLGQLKDDMAEVDPDAKLDPLIDRGCRIALEHFPLHVDREPHGSNDAREFDQHSVAGRVDYPPMVFDDLGGRRARGDAP